MPIEVRHVLFDRAEVQAALLAYHRRRALPKRSLSVADFTVEDSPVLRAFLSFLDDEGTLDVVEFAGTEIAAALILYCRQTRVPLPARASKELKVYSSGDLCMSLALNAPESLKLALALP
jgi:hypothetical protein